MLGETKGTSAGGAAEAGKSLRVPGTNPFFFDDDALQANRLLELLETMPDLEAYILNTGRVGGEDDASKKVEISDSSAIVEAIVNGSIEWVRDPDFGYEVAAAVPGVADTDLLQPINLYTRQGREDEYREMAGRLRSERTEYLLGFAAMSDSVLAGLNG
jgi:phosphoenolpyruvate carboxykinase (ATP)